MTKLLIKLAIFFAHCSAFSFDIDKAFEAQNKTSHHDTSIAKEASNAINNSSSLTQGKIDELNENFADKMRESARQANYNADYEKRSSTDWTIISEKNGGGLAHWYKREIIIRCNFGKKANESHFIHLLNSGKWSGTYCGGGFDSFTDAAQSCCRSSSY